MPYFIEFKYNSGKISTLGPVAPDNPASIHVLEDRRIKRSCENFVKRINRTSDDVTCKTIHK